MLNYTNTTNRGPGDPDQYAASAVSRIPLIDPVNIPPMRLYNSLSETMPHQQMEGFGNALVQHGFANFAEIQLSGSQHAFHYWNTPITPGGPTVGEDVIAFLNANLP